MNVGLSPAITGTILYMTKIELKSNFIYYAINILHLLMKTKKLSDDRSFFKNDRDQSII